MIMRPLTIRQYRLTDGGYGNLNVSRLVTTCEISGISQLRHNTVLYNTLQDATAPLRHYTPHRST
jgi:hypothetical protein